jgi:hypothetical protein
MKLFLVLGVLASGYVYVLLHTTDIVLAQTQQLNATYQYVGSHADAIASGQSGQGDRP